MSKFTLKSFDEQPLLEECRLELGMSREEYLQHIENVIQPNFEKMSERLIEFKKDRVSEDGKFITKYDEETGLHIKYEIKTGKEVSRKRYEFSV